MKELSIHISEVDMNGFSYSLKKNSLLLYNKVATEEDSFYSVIANELNSREDIKVKVIWNNRSSLLIPSVVFRIEDLFSYVSCISSVIYSPQCIQWGEFVAVWNTDERINTFNQISEEFGVSIIHSHERVEQIISTIDDTISYNLVDNLLYISERVSGKLYNSYVAEVYDANDALYYIKSTSEDNPRRITTSLPEEWVSYLSNYVKLS